MSIHGLPSASPPGRGFAFALTPPPLPSIYGLAAADGDHSVVASGVGDHSHRDAERGVCCLLAAWCDVLLEFLSAYHVCMCSVLFTYTFPSAHAGTLAGS
jgi:hypothetical protein